MGEGRTFSIAELSKAKLSKQVLKLIDSFTLLTKIRKLSSIYAVFTWGFSALLDFEFLNQGKTNQNGCIYTSPLGHLIRIRRAGMFFKLRSLVLGSHQANQPTEPLRLQVTHDGPAQSTDEADVCSSLITHN